MSESNDGLLRIEGILEYGYGIMPFLILADKRVSSSAVRLYGVLQNLARKSDRAFPKQEYLAQVLGIRTPRVSELTSELEYYGYIEKIYENRKLVYIIKQEVNMVVDKDLFGEPIATREKVKTKKKANTGDREVLKEVGKFYSKLYEDAIGAVPIIEYGRDNKIFNKYIKQYGVDTFKEVLKLYFDDEWGYKVGFTVTGLQTVFSRLLMKVKKRGKGGGYKNL